MTNNHACVDYDCIIIGAGISGISAAHTLEKNNISYRILEARNRVGGRIFSDSNTCNFTIDRGAQWFHSADINPLVKIVESKGFKVKYETPNWGASHARNLLKDSDLKKCAQEFTLFFEHYLK